MDESPLFRRHGDHFHLARGISRRTFLKSASGATAAALGASLIPSFTAFAQGVHGGMPKPIAGGFPLGGSFFHVELPEHPALGTGTAATENPSTIGDFKGQVAMGYAQGMGERLDKVTAEVKQLPYEVDLRIMKGAYIDVNRIRRTGTFALI